MDEKPQDTGSLWLDTFVEFLCFGAIGRYLDGFGVHGWPRKAVYLGVAVSQFRMGKNFPAFFVPQCLWLKLFCAAFASSGGK